MAQAKRGPREELAVAPPLAPEWYGVRARGLLGDSWGPARSLRSVSRAAVRAGVPVLAVHWEHVPGEAAPVVGREEDALRRVSLPEPVAARGSVAEPRRVMSETRGGRRHLPLRLRHTPISIEGDARWAIELSGRAVIAWASRVDPLRRGRGWLLAWHCSRHAGCRCRRRPRRPPTTLPARPSAPAARSGFGSGAGDRWGVLATSSSSRSACRSARWQSRPLMPVGPAT